MNNQKQKNKIQELKKQKDFELILELINEIRIRAKINPDLVVLGSKAVLPILKLIAGEKPCCDCVYC